MDILENIAVTEIWHVATVFSIENKVYEITDRPISGLILCAQGQRRYDLNGKIYFADPTQAILVPQGLSYSICETQKGILHIINFKCENFDCDTIFELPLSNLKSCIKDFESIKKLFPFKENRLQMYSELYELLDKISKEQSPQNGLLYSAVKYIEDHLSEPSLSNTVLAKHAKISETYLRRLFLVQLNTTPKQYILDRRIRKAKQRLADTSIKIADISEECGFSSPYHFCRIFKGKTGLTPTQYARQNRMFIL